MAARHTTLPASDEVVISIPTTRWVMDEIQRHAASGRFPRSFAACAEEFLRIALRNEERRASRPKAPTTGDDDE